MLEGSSVLRFVLLSVSLLSLGCRGSADRDSQVPKDSSTDPWIPYDSGPGDSSPDGHDSQPDTDEPPDTDGPAPEWFEDCSLVEKRLALVHIQSGVFFMGSSAMEPGHDPDEQQIAVTLTRDFRIGATEVTQGEWVACMGYEPKSDRPNKCSANCPVETVNWYEAAHFANRLSEVAGLENCYECAYGKRGHPAGIQCESAMSPYECDGYRLATSAEWEYAARAGRTAAYTAGGDLVDVGDLNNCGEEVVLDNGAILGDFAWYCGNNNANPVEVRQLEPNPWGLYDMQGNVWEWTNDLAWGYKGAVTDPVGADSGTDRIRRGGSFWSNPDRLRLALHVELAQWISNYNLGFRVARSFTELGD